MADYRPRLGIPSEPTLTEEYADRYYKETQADPALTAETERKRQFAADVNAIRAGNYSTPDQGEIDTDMGRIASFGSNVARGFTQGIGSVGKALGDVTEVVGNKVEGAFGGDPQYRAEDTLFYKAGQAVEDFGKQADVNPKYQDELTSKVGHGLGTMGSMIGGGVLGYAAKGTKLAAGAGSMAVAEGMIEQEIIGDLEQQLGRRATTDERMQALGVAAPIAGMELLPLGRAMNRMGGAGVTKEVIEQMIEEGGMKALTKGASTTAKKGLTGGAEEAVQEGLEQTAMNINAANVMAYDRDREAFEGLREAAEVGGATGFLVNAVAAGLGVKLKHSAAKADRAEDGILDKDDADIAREAEAVAQPDQPEGEFVGPMGPTEESFYEGAGQLSPIDPITGMPVPQEQAREGDFVPSPLDERVSTEEIQARDEAITQDYNNYVNDTNSMVGDYYSVDGLPNPELRKRLTDERMRLLSGPEGQETEMTDENLLEYRSIAVPNYKALVETSWWTKNEKRANRAVTKFISNMERGVPRATGGMTAKEAAVIDDIFTYDKLIEDVIVNNRTEEGIVDAEQAAIEFVEKATPEEGDAVLTPEEAETMIDEVVDSPKYKVADDTGRPEQVTEEEQPTATVEEVKAVIAEQGTRVKKTTEEKLASLSAKIDAYEAGEDVPIVTDGQYKLQEKYRKELVGAEVSNYVRTGQGNIDNLTKEAVDAAKKDLEGQDPDNLEDINFMWEEKPATLEGESLANADKFVAQSVEKRVQFHGTFHPEFDVVDPDKGELGMHVGTSAAAVARVSSLAAGRASTGEVASMEQMLEEARVTPMYINITNPFPMADINNFKDPEALYEEIQNQIIENEFAPAMMTEIQAMEDAYFTKMLNWQKKIDEALNNNDDAALERIAEQEDIIDSKETASIREFLEKHKFDGVAYANAMEDAGNVSYIVFDPKKVKHAAQNTGAFDPADPNMKQRLGEEIKPGMPKGDRVKAKIVLAKMQKQLKAAGIKVSIVEDWKNIPRWLNGEINKQIAGGDVSKAYRIKGAVRGDEIAIMLDNITDIKEMQNTVFHEVIGHYSMETMFGENFNKFLDKIAGNKNNKSALTSIADLYGADLTTVEGKRLAAKEYVAKLAEDGTNPSMIKRIVTWVRHQLRKLGIAVKISEGDIRGYVAEAANKFEKGKLPDTPLTSEEVNFAMSKTAPDKAKFIEADALVKTFTEKGYSNPLEIIQDGIQKKANVVMDVINDKIGNKLSVLKALPDKPEYKGLRNAMQGMIYYYDKTSTFIRDQLGQETQENKDAVYDYLTSTDVNIDTVPEHLREATDAARTTIDRLEETLIDEGILQKDKFEGRGDYLPQVYLYFVTGNPKSLNISGGAKMSAKAYLKGRKLDPKNAKDKEVMELLGHIKDPGYLAAHSITTVGRDLSIGNFFSALKEYGTHQSVDRGESNPWVFPTDLVEYRGRKVSLFHLEEELANLEANVAKYDMSDATTAAVEEISGIIAAAKAEESTLSEAGLDYNLYQQLPKDKKRYGSLAGLSVRKEIANDIGGNIAKYTENPSMAEKLMGENTLTTLNKIWKGTKTVDNPSGHARNFVGNFVLMDMSTKTNGVKLAANLLDELKQQVGAYKTGVASKSRYREIAERFGIPMSTFTATETVESKKEWIYELEKEIADAEVTLAGKFGKYAPAVVASSVLKLHDKLAHAYQGSETLFKVTKIRDSIEQWEAKTGRKYSDLKGNERLGLEQAAVDEANKAILDYSMVPDSIRWLRNAPIGAPFLTFSYLASGRVIENTIRHPVKMMQYYSIPWVMSELVLGLQDIDDDELERWEASLPEFMEQTNSYHILPIRNEDTGEIYSMNVGYWLPYEPMTRFLYNDLAKQLADPQGDVDLAKALGNLGVLTGPVVDTISVLRTGIDPFTNRPISDPYSSTTDQTLDKLAYMYNMITPPIFSTSGGVSHVKSLVMGDIDPKTGLEKDDLLTSVPRLAGINIYKTDPQQSAQSRRSYYKSEIDKQIAHNRKEIRDANITRKSPEDIAAMRKTHRDLVKSKRETLRRYNRRFARGEG